MLKKYKELMQAHNDCKYEYAKKILKKLADRELNRIAESFENWMSGFENWAYHLDFKDPQPVSKLFNAFLRGEEPKAVLEKLIAEKHGLAEKRD